MTETHAGFNNASTSSHVKLNMPQQLCRRLSERFPLLTARVKPEMQNNKSERASLPRTAALSSLEIALALITASMGKDEWCGVVLRMA